MRLEQVEQRMHVIQLFLPLFDNGGHKIPQNRFSQTAGELEERFGGLTAYTRAPAQGFWKPGGKKVVRDDVVIYEVLSSRLQKKWWADKRRELEKRFRQRKLLIRAYAVVTL